MNREKDIHIAYAEDHIAVRKGIISLLETLGGIAVDIEADNGVQMLEQLVKAKKLPDLCIIDINMPEMDGFNLLIEIKKRWPRMRTLILTLFGSEAYIIKMIKNGANGYLLKSCNPSEIKLAIETIHETGYYYSQVADSDKFSSVLNNVTKQLQFSDAEKEFLTYVGSDLSYAEIADKMHTTLRSIKGCRDRLFAKLTVNTRVALAVFAIQSGIVPLPISNHINNK